MRYRFLDIDVDTLTGEVRRNGHLVPLEPLLFRLLLHMLRNPQRVLSYDELLTQVWNVAVLSRSAVNAAVSNLRSSLGDSGKDQRIIKTSAGVGYRFVADLSKDAARINEASSSKAIYPEKPSVALMGFRSIAGDEGAWLLAQGLTADLQVSLCRLPHLFTVSRVSAAQVDAHALDPRMASRMLGARFLVFGDITCPGPARLCLTVSIVCGASGEELWSEQYLRSIDDLPAVQGELLQFVVAVVEAVVTKAEIERAFTVPSEQLDAWQCYHRGLWHIDRPTENDVVQALTHFHRAIELDPRMGRAYAGLSILHATRVFVSVEEDMHEAMDLARDFAQEAISLEQQDALAHWAWGKYLYLASQHDSARSVYERVMSLSPSYAHAYLAQAVVSAHAGRDEEALALLDHGECLRPCDPLQYAQDAMRAIACVQLGRWDDAVRWSRKATAAPNAYFMTSAVAAACEHLAGEEDRAKALAAAVLAQQPDFSVAAYRRSFPQREEQGRECFINALHAVGFS